MIKLRRSPIDKIIFEGRQYFLKRDDLLDPVFSGNKARKFYYLLNNDFPHVKKIIGHGSAQSNSLYTLSVIARLKNWQFDYYVDHIPALLINDPAGNYQAALANGANIIPLQCSPLQIQSSSRQPFGGDVGDYINREILPKEHQYLLVPEGGRYALAEPGVKLLAEEILCWARQTEIDDLKIALPSGTGTTALYLQKHLPFEVLTCACVGGSRYLKKQFMELSVDEACHPTILLSDKKYHFGKLYQEFYHIWQALLAETGVEFDLLYDPLGWITLLDFVDRSRESGAEFLYIHQGGLLGNETMLPRYLRKYV